MEKFAILHETEKGQILITKEFNNVEELHVINIIFLITGAQVTTSVEIKEETEAYEIFKTYESQEQALTTVNNLRKELGIN